MTRRRVVLSVCFGALLAFYLSYSPAEMSGQTREPARTKPIRKAPAADLSKAPIFEVSGGKAVIPRGQDPPEPDRSPRAQDPPEPERFPRAQEPPEPDRPVSQKAQINVILKKLGKSQPGDVYAKVTPSQPVALNRAALVFVGMDSVDSGDSRARWALQTNKQHPYLVLWIRSAAERSYLVTCGAYSWSGSDEDDSSTFRNIYVTAQNGMIQHKLPGSGPISFAVVTHSVGWYPITIAPEPTSYTGLQFNFDFCELKNL